MLTPSLEQVKQLAKQYNTIPVFYDFSADNQTPINLYRAMSEGAKNAFIFESVNNGEQWGRYSFVGANPKQEIQMHRTTVCILENNQKKTFMVEHPILFLKERMAQYSAPVLPDAPNFTGGLIGYFGAAVIYERLNAELKNRKRAYAWIIMLAFCLFGVIQFFSDSI